jgi:hypothetical protein
VGDCVEVDGGVIVPVDELVEVRETDIVLDGEEEDVGVNEGVTEGVSEGPEPNPTNNEQFDREAALNPLASETPM